MTKRRTPLPVFSGEIFKNGRHSTSGRFPRKHSGWNHFSIIATLSCQSVNQKKNQKKDSTTKKCWMVSYVFSKNGWLLTISYDMRNIDYISRIKIKHNFFKSTFFPSAIIEWNKLDPAIRNAESLGIFKSNILNFFRPTPRSFFNCYNHKGIRLMIRLRLGLSRLREHKFNHNFQNCINTLCSCAIVMESTSHFFLHCSLCYGKTSTLLSTLNKIDCKLIETNESSLTETLLFGNSSFDLKKTPLFFLNASIDYK